MMLILTDTEEHLAGPREMGGLQLDLYQYEISTRKPISMIESSWLART